MSRVKIKSKLRFRIATLAVVFLIGSGVTTIFAVNGLFGGSVSESGDLTRGLAGYWNFDEGSGQTVNDASLNGNNGTLGANSSVGSDDPKWTSGKLYGAMEFDGADDIADLGGDASLLPDAWTISAWVKPDDIKNQHLVAFSASGSYPTISLEWGGTGRPIIIMSANNYQYFPPSAWATLKDGKWHHVAFTMPGSAQADITNAEMYLDGMPVAQYSGTSTAGQNGKNRFKVGAIGSGSSFYSGKIDEVRLYNRVLSANEVQRLYNERGPVAHWTFDEGSGQTAYDSAGSNDGTLEASMTDSDWVKGKYGGALDFDGTDDYVSVGNPSSLQITGNLSISSWVKTDTKAKRIVSKDDASSRDYFLRTDTITGQAAFGIFTSNVAAIVVGTTVLTDNKFHHVVGVNDGTDLLIYVDGVLENINYGGGGTIDNDTVNLEIGRMQTPDEYWKGSIDDVRIYNYARTADQIRLDYNAGYAAKFGGTPDLSRGLVGHWNFNEMSGITVNDTSGNSNDGTLTNNPTWASGPTTRGLSGGGGAIEFDGVNDYVDAGNDASLNDLTTYTYTAWIKPSALPTYQAIVVKNDFWNYGGLFMATGQLRGYRIYSGTDAASNSAEGIILVNEWQFVVMTYDESGDRKIHLYHNSQEVSYTIQNTSDGTLTSDAGKNLRISEAVTGRVFDGSIDDVRIYNRALTAEEIRYLYNNNGPIGYWKLGEVSGSAFDSSGEGNHGTVTIGAGTRDATALDGGDGSIDFDGADTKAQIADDAAIQNVFDGGGSVFFMFNADSDGELDQGRIVDKALWYTRVSGESGGLLRLDFRNLWSGDDGLWRTTTVMPTNETGYGVWSYDADSPNNNPTLYLYNATDGFRTFIVGDGLSNDGPPTGTRSTDVGSDFFIGNNAAQAVTFDGRIDEVKLFNYALSEQEARDLIGNAGYAAKFGGTPDLENGLVAHWSLDEGSGQTVIDMGAGGYNGTLGANSSVASDDPKWSQGPTARGLSAGGGALDFDDVDDYVRVSTNSAFDLVKNFTLSAWVNPRTQDIGDLLGIICKDYSTECAYGMVIDSGTNKINWRGRNENSVIQGFAANTALVLNVWTHAVITYDGAKIKIYLNGILDKEANETDNMIVTANPISIGRLPFSTRYYDGLIDDVRIYSRAITAEEVRYLYNNNGPVGHWRFDEGVGTTAYDSAGSNDGTLNGSMTDSDWVQGKYGTALDFDGSDDAVSVNDLDVSGNTITMTAWVKANSNGENNFGRVIDKGSSYGMYMSNNTITCEFTDATDMAALTTITGSWHFVACVLDASTEYVYVDGEISRTQATGTRNADNDDVMNIGNNAAGNRTFDGLIDDVRIYNYDRSAEQIRTDYNAGLSTYFR